MYFVIYAPFIKQLTSVGPSWNIFTYVDSGREGGGFLPLFVCMFFCMISQKNDAARITKLDPEMYPDEFWKPIYFEVTKKHASMGLCTRWVLAFSSLTV